MAALMGSDSRNQRKQQGQQAVRGTPGGQTAVMMIGEQGWQKQGWGAAAQWKEIVGELTVASVVAEE